MGRSFSPDQNGNSSTWWQVSGWSVVRWLHNAAITTADVPTSPGNHLLRPDQYQMHVPSQVSHRGSMAYPTKPNGPSSTVPTSMGPSHALVSLAVNFSRRRACCTASRASSAVPRGPIAKPSASLVIFAPGPYRGFQCFPAQVEPTHCRDGWRRREIGVP